MRLRGGLNDLQLGDHRLTHPLDQRQPGRSSSDDPVEITKGVEKQPRQRFQILPGDGAE